MTNKNLTAESLKSVSEGTRTDLHGVEVLASLLVAYPQVSRATYDPSTKTLSLIFLCRGPLAGKKRSGIITEYRDSIDVYLSLSGRTPRVVQASWEKLDRFYSFQVERDVTSLSPGELSLTVDLISLRASVISTAENASRDGVDESANTARLFLQDTLDGVRNLDGPRRLVAFREGERVLVFDK